MLKSPKNKTIDISVEEGKQYLERCITVTEPVQLSTVLNKTIVGDCFDVLPNLPHQSVDLAIVDPPYNLTKAFGNTTFYKMTPDGYREYTNKWLDLVLPLLKDDGTLYVCCDWKTSLIISDVLQKKSIVRNRITWQRDKGRGSKTNWKDCLEDIWFATKSDRYTFNPVKIRRQVMAPYKDNGKPKDWVATPQE